MSITSGEHKVYRGPSSCTGCSAMPLHLARRNVIGPPTGDVGCCPLPGILGQKFLPWILSVPGCSKLISGVSTTTSISRRGYWEKAPVMVWRLRESASPAWSLWRSAQGRWEHPQSPEWQDLACTPRSNSTLKFQTGTLVLHKHIEPESYGKALAVARDAHSQPLIAAHLLEDHSKWLSQQVSQGWSHSHRWSCSCRRSCSQRLYLMEVT